jgi:hypothetical protein
MAFSPEFKKRLIGLASSFITPYPTQVKGEQSYQFNLEKICGYYDEDEGYNDDSHTAAIYFENDNSFDPGNAVRVEIDDLTVGYLSRSDATKYRKKLVTLNAPENPVAICGASIRGGFIKHDEKSSLGVRLDFDLNGLTLTPVNIKD